MKPQYQQQVPQISDLLQAKLLSTEITHFNQMHIDVLDSKSKGKTCFEIPEICGFKSDQQLKRYLLRTLLGYIISGVSSVFLVALPPISL